MLFSPEEMGGVSLGDVIEAYYDCRRNKRNTFNALEFELDYERHCIDLWHELNEHRYVPRRSIAFVVEKPVKREIFAADFRDRVVHHLIARRIYPLLEAQFLVDSYSTQKGKGTLFGIQRVEQHIKECSENYTKDCYIMKLDIQGFFMSINKKMLYDCVCQFVDRHYKGSDVPLLLYMLRKTIFNRPELNCVRKVPAWRWRGLPKNKSLFGTDGTHGLPIGNLTSQLLALLFLDELDHFVTKKWNVPYFGRYVDDMVLVHPSVSHLLHVRQLIKEWVERHHLRLHPRKMYLQHFSKGVMFIGGMIKPGRKYVSHRTMGCLFSKIHGYNQKLADKNQVTVELLCSLLSTMNSYLGTMRHYNAQRQFCRVLDRMSSDWFHWFYVSRRGRRYKLVMRKIYTDAA